jgi:AraC-like DNA-binding protein
VVEAARLLGRPGVTIDGVAAAVGLSPRELRRRFPDHVGYGPKALHRVLRFQRFLGRAPDVAAGAASLASAAAEAGYADQSHLGRDCRRLSGSSPATLVGRWAFAAESGRSGRNVPDPG